MDRLWRPQDHALMCIDKIPEPRLLVEGITKHEGTDVATLRNLVLRSAPEAFPARDAVWLNAANSCLKDFTSRIVDRPVALLEMVLALGLPADSAGQGLAGSSIASQAREPLVSSNGAAASSAANPSSATACR